MTPKATPTAILWESVKTGRRRGTGSTESALQSAKKPWLPYPVQAVAAFIQAVGKVFQAVGKVFRAVAEVVQAVTGLVKAIIGLVKADY